MNQTSNSKTMLVLGATSEIALATIHLLAKEGWNFHLTSRELDKVAVLAHDIHNVYGCRVDYSRFDTDMSIQEQEAFWDNVLKTCTLSITDQFTNTNSLSSTKQFANTSALSPTGQLTNTKDLSLTRQFITDNCNLDAVLCAIGYLGKPQQAEHDLNEGQKIMMANYGGLIPVLSLAANYFELRKYGSLVVISSVAGERGRASNYAYGAAKAAMTAYLSGLRARLSTTQVQVLTVLPGLVKTKMIADKVNPKPCATPEQVAADIVKAIHKKRDVIYSVWYWRYIMLGVKLLPEALFKRIRNI